MAANCIVGSVCREVGLHTRSMERRGGGGGALGGLANAVRSALETNRINGSLSLLHLTDNGVSLSLSLSPTFEERFLTLVVPKKKIATSEPYMKH